MAFTACFRTIGRVGAGVRPPKTARTLALSMSARSRLIAPAFPNTVRSKTWSFDPTANAHAEIVVDFSPNPRFRVWTPAQMKEHYWQLRVASQGAPGAPLAPGIMNEQIEGTARYSNFRKFETSARIVTPRP